MGYKDKYEEYLQKQSKLKIDVVAEGPYGASIESYEVVANGETYKSANAVTNELKKAGEQTITVTVTDSRRRKTTVTENILVVGYSAPVISKLKVKRVDASGAEKSNGEYVQVLFSAEITPLNNLNSAFYYVEYKKTTETDYTSIELKEDRGSYKVTDALYNFTADTGSSYDVRLVAKDDINTTYKTTVASTGFTLIHWLANGLGMGIGKIAELVGVLDIGFQTRFSGGIKPVFLVAETNLNDVILPGFYAGENVTEYKYANCPIVSGTFSLEVIAGGEDGQVKQKLTSIFKTSAKVYERFYYQGSWGEWICTSDFNGTLLWSGSEVMDLDTVITLNELITEQAVGVNLIFSASTGGNWISYFIPKKMLSIISNPQFSFVMSAVGNYKGQKKLKIEKNQITGFAFNTDSGEDTDGTQYDNSHFVLRYVIGV